MRIILTALLLAAAGPTSAADTPEAWLIPFAAAYQPPVSGFNSAFASHGMPAARGRHFGWGLELRTFTGSFLVGPLFFKTWDDVDSSMYHLRTEATGIFGEMGLRLTPASFLTIVPLLGIGGLSQSFGLRENTDDIGFDTLFDHAPANLSLSAGTKLAGLGALEIGLSASSSSGRIGVALRGGYLYSPFTPTWRLSNGAALRGAPDDRLGGLFFSAGLLLMPQAQVASETY